MKRFLSIALLMMFCLPLFAQHGGAGAHESVRDYLKRVNTNINFVSGSGHYITFEDGTTQSTASTSFDGDLAFTDPGDQALWTQTSTTGTEFASGDPTGIFFINDDRTGATADETEEATLSIDAEGSYAVYVKDGGVFLESGAALECNQSLKLYDTKPLRFGGSDDITDVYNTNGAGDDLLVKVFENKDANNTPVWLWSQENVFPSGWTDLDDQENPTLAWLAQNGADANDAAGVYMGGFTADVSAAWGFEFRAVTTALDNSADVTTTEVAPYFKFTDASGGTPAITKTAGDVYITEDIDIDGYIQGSTLNDMASYKLAGDILSIGDLNDSLILAWVTPATTETDLSPNGNDATYQGSMTTDDQIAKGEVWTLDLDGSDDYLSVSDSADFTFDDAGGANGFTVGAWVQVVNAAAAQTIISKWDETTSSELREWRLFLNSSEVLTFAIYDESANVQCFRYSDAAISVGWHLIEVVYSGAGGATAANGITFYVDGSAISSTASNDGSYVGMEDTATDVFVGAITGTGGTTSEFMTGDIGVPFMTTDQFSADEIWESYLKTRGYYGL